MKRLITLISMLILTLTVSQAAMAGTAVTDYDSVRQMCTVPDNPDFSVFDQALLPGVLVKIIETDSENAPMHKAVVYSAIKTLGAMHVPEAVPVLIEKAPDYTTTCIYWLATYADPLAVDAIVSYLASDDVSVRYEAADALGRVIEPTKDTGAEYVKSLTNALSAVGQRIDSESDASVVQALWDATSHLMTIALQPGEGSN